MAILIFESHPSKQSLNMHWINMSFHQLRTPVEPSPPSIREPKDPPENPDMPVREPDPEDPHDM
jgi:hypothetical protein